MLGIIWPISYPIALIKGKEDELVWKNVATRLGSAPRSVRAAEKDERQKAKIQQQEKRIKELERAAGV